MPDYITKDEAEAIAKHIAKHGVTKIKYLTVLPVETGRPITVWGKGKGRKRVSPVKRVVNR